MLTDDNIPQVMRLIANMQAQMAGMMQLVHSDDPTEQTEAFLGMAGDAMEDMETMMAVVQDSMPEGAEEDGMHGDDEEMDMMDEDKGPSVVDGEGDSGRPVRIKFRNTRT